MPAEPLFLFGTLRHAPLLNNVAGVDLATEPARLPGHAILHAVSPDGAEQKFPVCLPHAGSWAEGVLIRPDEAARARLDAYERVFGYDLGRIRVETAAGPLEAAVYQPESGRWSGGGTWSLDAWAKRTGALTTEVAGEVMALLAAGTAPRSIDARYPMLESLVASRARARANPAPATQRRVAAPDDTQIEAHRRPYTWFFATEESDLRFRRFDGGFSAPVTRAGFLMADAVTVLPYDPIRDTVMLVEQFRYGPHLRGDPNPWSLEPIAGRIDGMETPEAAARRETLEETGLRVGALDFVGRYYVSPGAVSEYLYSYVARIDMPPEAAGIGGLDDEHEDIRSHVVPFARLMALIDSGEVENAPLLISAQWLAMHRDRLRGA